MIAIISDEKMESIGNRLYDILKEQPFKTMFLPVSSCDIKPCYSCGGCETKTFGKCVIRDDMDKILPVLAKADTFVLVSPVVWGGPSFIIKKLMDKSALLGNRFYRMKHKELVKGTCVGLKNIVVLGITDSPNAKQAKDFIFWGNEVGNIMDLHYISKVMCQNPDNKEIDKLAKEIAAYEHSGN